MNNLIIDVNNDPEALNKIILSKKINFDNSSKYFIYITDELGNLSNLIIKIPPVRLLYNYNNNNYNQVNFPLNPNYCKVKKFNSLILTLENYLQELLNKPKLNWISSIKKIKTVKYIKVNYFDKKIKILSKDNISSINNFEAGSEVEVALHVSSLWIKDKKVGINFDICQIKYTSLLFDDNFFGNIIKKSSNKIIKNDYDKTDDVKIETKRFVIQKDLLEKQKLKLKKIDVSNA